MYLFKKNNLKTKLTYGVVLSALCISVFGNNTIVRAERKADSKAIPLFMQPGTIIVYDDNLDMTILKGGFSDKKVNCEQKFSIQIPDLPDDLSVNEKQSFKKLQQDMQNDIENGEYNEYPQSYPFPGEKVEYGEDGYVYQCYYRDEQEPDGYSIHQPENFPQPAAITTTKHWGKYNNYISYNTSDGATGSTTGYGRFTSYADKTGNHDNTLVDGDVATDQSLDTIRWGTQIKARNDDPSSPGYNTKYSNYIKNDVGPLCGPLHGNNDDAVLDVFGKNGAGLTHLGVKKGVNVSLNKAHYYHKGISRKLLYK